jgi:hypothetical protein
MMIFLTKYIMVFPIRQDKRKKKTVDQNFPLVAINCQKGMYKEIWSIEKNIPCEDFQMWFKFGFKTCDMIFSGSW